MMNAQLHVSDGWNLNTSIGVIGGVGSLDYDSLKNPGLAILSSKNNVPILRKANFDSLKQHPAGLLMFIPAILRERKGGLEATLFTATDLKVPVAVDLTHLLYMLTLTYRGKVDETLTVDKIVTEITTFLTTVGATEAAHRRLPPRLKLFAYAIWAAYPLFRRGWMNLASWFMYLDESTILDMQMYLQMISEGVNVVEDLDIFDKSSSSIIRDWLAAGYLLALANSDPSKESLGDALPGSFLKSGETASVDGDTITVDSQISNTRYVIPVRRRIFEIWEYFIRTEELVRVPIFYFYLSGDSERASWDRMETALRRTAENKSYPAYKNLTAARDKGITVDVDFREV